jgi:hypothetical protein
LAGANSSAKYIDLRQYAEGQFCYQLAMLVKSGNHLRLA